NSPCSAPRRHCCFGSSGHFWGSVMRKVSFVAALVLALGLAGGEAHTRPSKPITLIVPFPAGGPADAVARIFSDHMKGTLGQPILVETVHGACGTHGLRRRRTPPP